MVSSGLGMLLPNRYFKRKAKEMDKEHEASSARLMKSLDEERKRRAELEQEVTRVGCKKEFTNGLTERKTCRWWTTHSSIWYLVFSFGVVHVVLITCLWNPVAMGKVC